MCCTRKYGVLRASDSYILREKLMWSSGTRGRVQVSSICGMVKVTVFSRVHVDSEFMTLKLRGDFFIVFTMDPHTDLAPTTSSTIAASRPTATQVFRLALLLHPT